MAGKLTVAAVKALTKPGKYGDGDGLWLQVRSATARSWLLRYTRDGRSREMGLGNFPVVSLAAARDLALAARRQIAAGVDPLEARDAAKAAKEAEAEAAITFRVVAAKYIAAYEAGWRSKKHAAQWSSTLEWYAYPVIGDVAVAAITTGDVTRILEPIWSKKPETASRVRGRIEAILDLAAAMKWRSGENPGRLKGNLSYILPARSKVRAVRHHPALPWADAATFMKALRARDGMGARALEFAILTAARSGEVRGATWAEIDLGAAVWTVPGGRMKGGREHRVPLSDAALALVRELLPEGGETPHPAALVFQGTGGRPLSDMTLTAALKRMDRSDVTAHGFRSSFRDWASEATAYDRDTIEMALAHAVASKVEAAYRRGDLFQKRRRLMNDWAAFCGGAVAPSADVVPIRAAG